MVANLNKLSNQKSVSYASIYVANSTVVQSIPTGAAYTKVDLFTTDGLEKRCDALSSTDKITINKNGVYFVSGTFNVKSKTSSITLKGSVFLNGTAQNSIFFKHFIGASSRANNISLSGLLSVTSAPKDIDLRVNQSYSTKINIVFEYANLNVISID